MSLDSHPPQKDLDDTIEYASTAIKLFPLGDARSMGSCAGISTYFFTRYKRQKDTKDLWQAIYFAQQVWVNSPSNKRLESLKYLRHLLISFSHDFQILTELAKRSRDALDLLPPGGYQRVNVIRSLLKVLHRTYVTHNSIAHLREAIDLSRQLLDLLPYGSGDWHSQLRSHSVLLEHWWNERQRGADSVEMAEIESEMVESEVEVMRADARTHLAGGDIIMDSAETRDNSPDNGLSRVIQALNFSSMEAYLNDLDLSPE